MWCRWRVEWERCSLVNDETAYILYERKALTHRACYNGINQREDDGTMAQPQMLEGTGEELQRMLAQFPHERFRLIPLSEPEAESEQNENSSEETGSLYDLLGDYVGCVEGSGESNAARASELFTEYVVKKHAEGHL
ncbi:MAG: hypothetical protein JWL77_2841 [Chthonomonadaceae bacterium]|nr:hypothetical protein [Chthonomonadaceae bacterium]